MNIADILGVAAIFAIIGYVGYRSSREVQCVDDFINIMYLGGLFYSTAVFFPLVIGLVWKRATAPAAFVSMLCAVAVGLVSEFFLAGKAPGILGLPSNVMAAATSLVVFVVITALTKSPPAEKTAFLSKT